MFRAINRLMQATNAACTRQNKRLVDDFICSHQHCWWYCQTECFQRLLVNDETEAGWLRPESARDLIGLP